MGIIFSLFFPKCLTGYIFLTWNNLESRIDRDALQNTLGVQTFSIFVLDSLGHRCSLPSCKTTYLFWIQGRKIEVKKSKGYPPKMKILASGHITSWQIDLETIETVTDFIFLGFKITPDGDCHHEIKKHLLLGRKAMTNLDNILKSRGITLMTKVCLVKVMVFPVVMYGCESWTIKKVKC